MKQFSTSKGNFIAVEVPGEATDISLGDYHHEEGKFTLYYNFHGDRTIDLPYDPDKDWLDFSLLGTIHYDNGCVFDFDPDLVVETYDEEFEDGSKATLCKCYLNQNDWHPDPHYSFISLLQANGMWFVNQYGNAPESGREKLYGSHDTSAKSQVYHVQLHERIERWQSAEDARIKGKLVILKID